MTKQSKLFNRKSLRLKRYDYSTPGGYFVTICCHNRGHRFGKIIDGVMYLNALGKIAESEWLKLPQRFPHITLKEFIVMQDHMHGIIYINGGSNEGIALAGTPSMDMPLSATSSLDTPSSESPSSSALVLGSIVGAYKSLVMTQCLKLFKKHDQPMGKFWHRNYHERIIRGGLSYYFISAYIINNPKKWEDNKSKSRQTVKDFI